MARTKAAKTKAMRTKASRSKSKSGCSACKERRLNCDETLPICQRCRDDGRECKGMSTRISASSETLPPSNPLPIANIRAKAGHADSLPSEAEPPPSDVSAPDNRTLVDTCVKDPISNNGEAQLGASQTDNVSGVEEGSLTTESEWLEEQAKRLQESQNVRLVARRGNSYQALALGALEQAEQSTGCDGSENSKKRTSDVVSPTTIDRSKRARGDKDDRKIKEWIAVSFGPAGDHIETGSESEPLPESEALRPASPADSSDTQSSDGCEAVQEAQMALLVANEEPTGLIPFSRTELSRVNMTPTPEIELGQRPTHPSGNQSSRIIERSASLHQDLSSTTEALGEGRGNTALSIESGNHEYDPQPASPADIPPCSSQERSNVPVPSNARHSTTSPPIETEQHSGKPRNAQRPVNHSQSASAGQGKLRPLLPHTLLPTMKQSQAASANGLLPTLNSSHRQGTCKSGSPSSLEAMAGLNDSYQASPHQQAGRQAISRGGGDSVNHNHREPFANIANTGNPTRRGIGSGSQLRLQEQHPRASSPMLPLPQLPLPTVRFTADTRIEGTVSEAAIQPYFELFSRHGQVIVHLKRTSRNKILPMSVIMWQSAFTFHRWYRTETGTVNVSTLRFELLNSESKVEKVFFVYDGDADAFQRLKQCLWDLFWARFSFNSATATFQVFIRAFHHPPEEHFVDGPVGVSAGAMNPVASPWSSATTRFEDIGVVGSQAPGDATGVAEYVPEQPQPGASQPRDSRRQQIGPVPGPEIIIRLQIDGIGKVSEPYDRAVLRARITTRDFFTWFVSETGRGGRDTPSSLTFTFKDAMPAPISSTIRQGNEDHFNLMKRDIQTQFEKANNLASGLKEFAIFVTDPNWVVEADPW
ncbi:hypothetical protein DL98DRAFT_574723 [Cadophora sp. DSE1049]|nr:hypothetical protein DL98DRAFT_574723 [Cadophora sp. DSE1049]